MPVSQSLNEPTSRRNLELKVRVSPEGLGTVRKRLRDIATGEPEILYQEDRYFQVPDGRLKLRTIACETAEPRAELIAYQRPNHQGSRWSTYRITPLASDQASSIADTLAQVLPVLVVVRKRREVHFLGATRVHLDDVEGLGAFVELETVIGSQADDSAAAEHRQVIESLGLDAWPVEAGSYSDLLRGSRRAHVEDESDE